MEEKLKQKLKEKQRANIIAGAVTCAILCAFIIMTIATRVNNVQNGNTETRAFLNFGSICLIVILIVVFVKKILLICLDLLKGDEKYEKLIVTVVQLKIVGIFMEIENITPWLKITRQGSDLLC